MQVLINTCLKISVPTFINYTFLFLILTQGLWVKVLNIGNVGTVTLIFCFFSVYFALLTGRNYLILFEGKMDLKRTTLIILIALSIYVALGMLFQQFVLKRSENLLGNSLSLKACMMAFFTMFAHTKGWLNKKWLFILLTISLTSIFFAATRKALAGWIIIVFLPLFTRFNLYKPADFLKMILLIAGFFFAYNHIMENTHLGERFYQIQEQGQKTNKTNIKALDILADRAIQYDLAWDQFLRKPYTGIGLRNFQVVTKFPYVLHSEYMVQLCECGIIGTILYMLFLGGIIAKIVKQNNKENNKVFFICLGAILCMLFISFTTWTYQGHAYFAMYGLILSTYCNDGKANFKISYTNMAKKIYLEHL